MSRQRGVAGIAQLPGFVDSLRLLLVDERYAAIDVALMFGVSRERIRQLCFTHGIKQPLRWKSGLHATRLWDDATNRFRPVENRILRLERLQQRRGERLRTRVSARAARRRKIVEKIVSLSTSLNREPTWKEIGQALGLSSNNPTSYCQLVLNQWTNGYRNAARSIIEIRRATGLKGRRAGNPGHINPRSRRQQADQEQSA